MTIQYSSSAIELNENGMSDLQAKALLNDEMIQEILAIDGVEKVSEIKNFGVKFDFPMHDEYGNNDFVYPLTDKETETIGKYVEEGTADYDKLISGDYVLVSDNANVEEIYGWKFNVGDKMTLHYYDGNKMTEKEVTVLGILNNQYTLDNDRLEGWFIMPEQAILSFVSYDTFSHYKQTLSCHRQF